MQAKALKYRYVLAFGSNLGDRRQNCEKAIAALEGAVRFLRFSTWVTTPALQSAQHDTSDHEDYLNFLCDVASDLEPDSLYAQIVKVEDALGHSRVAKWRPRGIDIDIVFWALNKAKNFAECPSLTVQGEGLHIPHPAFPERLFWQELLQELGS